MNIALPLSPKERKCKCHASPLLEETLKRGVDLVGASSLLLLSSPILLAAALGVRLSSDGPILFRQVRIGKNGEEFLL